MVRRARIFLAASGVAAITLVLSGCEKPLFPRNLPRTQYERYDQLSGHYVPAERVTPRGTTEPALRERLSPYQR